MSPTRHCNYRVLFARRRSRLVKLRTRRSVLHPHIVWAALCIRKSAGDTDLTQFLRLVAAGIACFFADEVQESLQLPVGIKKLESSMRDRVTRILPSLDYNQSRC